jgi:hypothetical protein
VITNRRELKAGDFYRYSKQRAESYVKSFLADLCTILGPASNLHIPIVDGALG